MQLPTMTDIQCAEIRTTMIARGATITEKTQEIIHNLSICPSCRRERADSDFGTAHYHPENDTLRFFCLCEWCATASSQSFQPMFMRVRFIEDVMKVLLHPLEPQVIISAEDYLQ